MPQVPALLETGAVRRPRGGHPHIRPKRVAGDDAYTGRRVRQYLRRGVGAAIPRLKHEKRQG